MIAGFLFVLGAIGAVVFAFFAIVFWRITLSIAALAGIAVVGLFIWMAYVDRQASDRATAENAAYEMPDALSAAPATAATVAPIVDCAYAPEANEECLYTQSQSDADQKYGAAHLTPELDKLHGTRAEQEDAARFAAANKVVEELDAQYGADRPYITTPPAAQSNGQIVADLAAQRGANQ